MKGTSVTTAVSQGREARRLSTLLEVSQALSGTLNLKSALHRVLEVLANHHGAIRSMVTLVPFMPSLSVSTHTFLSNGSIVTTRLSH